MAVRNHAQAFSRARYILRRVCMAAAFTYVYAYTYILMFVNLQHILCRLHIRSRMYKCRRQSCLRIYPFERCVYVSHLRVHVALCCTDTRGLPAVRARVHPAKTAEPIRDTRRRNDFMVYGNIEISLNVCAF